MTAPPHALNMGGCGSKSRVTARIWVQGKSVLQATVAIYVPSIMEVRSVAHYVESRIIHGSFSRSALSTAT